MWLYLRDTLVPALHVADDNPIVSSKFAVDTVSMVIGVARLRQLRVEPATCIPVRSVRLLIPECYAEYAWSDEDSMNYNGSWRQPIDGATGSVHDPTSRWSYQYAMDLQTMPAPGVYATYAGGGYITELPTNTTHAQNVIDNLMAESWVDRRTRAVIVEFSIYNPHSNLFTVVLIFFETPNTGGVRPYAQIMTSKLYFYTNTWEYFIAGCEVLFVLLALIVSIRTIRRALKNSAVFFKVGIRQNFNFCHFFCHIVAKL